MKSYVKSQSVLVLRELAEAVYIQHGKYNDMFMHFRGAKESMGSGHNC